jgi:hypothetical protein
MHAEQKLQRWKSSGESNAKALALTLRASSKTLPDGLIGRSEGGSRSRQAAVLPFLLSRRDTSELVEEVQDERQVVLNDHLAFGSGCYSAPTP